MAETYENEAESALPKNTDAMRAAMMELKKSLEAARLDPEGQKFAGVLLGEYLRIQENMKRYYEAKAS